MRRLLFILAYFQTKISVTRIFVMLNSWVYDTVTCYRWRGESSKWEKFRLFNWGRRREVVKKLWSRRSTDLLYHRKSYQELTNKRLVEQAVKRVFKLSENYQSRTAESHQPPRKSRRSSSDCEEGSSKTLSGGCRQKTSGWLPRVCINCKKEKLFTPTRLAAMIIIRASYLIVIGWQKIYILFCKYSHLTSKIIWRFTD